MTMTDFEWLALWHLLRLLQQYAPAQEDKETAKWFLTRIGDYLQEQQEQIPVSLHNNQE